MADLLPAAEQARIRVAAMVAAGNAILGESIIARIVDEAGSLSSPEDRIRHAIARTREHLGTDRPVNYHATPNDQLQLARLGRGLAPWERLMIAAALASDSDTSETSATGARYDGISGTDAAFLTAMRSHAMRHGLGWAADRPEILRLGPEAIELFARTNFQRQSYERLKEAGFEARDAVSIARHADRNGLDANDIARRTAGAVTSFGGDSPEGRRRWVELFRNYYNNPGDVQARTELDRALTEVETRGTPQQREQVQELRPLLRLDEQERRLQHTTEVQANTAVVAHTAAVTTHTAAVTANDDLMAGLNAGPVALTGQRADAEPRPLGSQRTTVAENTVQPSGPRLG